MIDFSDYLRGKPLSWKIKHSLADTKSKKPRQLDPRVARIVDATTRQITVNTEPYEFITSAPFKEGDEALIRHDKGVNKVIFVRDKQGHGWLVDTGWSLSE